MLNFLKDIKLRKEIQASFDQIHVPKHISQMLNQISDYYEGEDIKSTYKGSLRRSRFMSVALTFTMFIAIIAGAMNFTPAFAEMIKNIPILSHIQDWLEGRREIEGVQNALNNHYIPIEPVVVEKDGVTVTISDIYLSENHFSYKAMIQADRLKNHVYKRDDGRLDVDKRKLDIFVDDGLPHYGVRIPLTGGSEVIESSNNEPIFVEYFESVGDISNEIQMLLDQNLNVLPFEVRIGTLSGENVTTFPIQVPFDKANLVPDKVIELHQEIAIQKDPDYQKLIIEKAIISPTRILVDIINPNPENEIWFFGRSRGDDPIMIDNQGQKYHLFSADKIGNDYYDNSKYRLTFGSSPYFDDTIENLNLFINKVRVSGKPESTFTLSLQEDLPKKVVFKNREFMIHDIKYQDGFLTLKMAKQNFNMQNLNSTVFIIPKYLEQVSSDPKLIEFYDKNPVREGNRVVKNDEQEEIEVILMAPPNQSYYDISMLRNNDEIEVNESVNVQIK